ncbi:hypothetical protein [Streptomyces sp. NL15-2K]|nr:MULTISPECIES: hypothetical protein [Actinomycetes]WKX13195.1 hypothetical protein Q4V64_39000 [Kutzneria buriramensis]GCB45462.1 hypothetical protein SNL152K_2752 [Streptomyces sp. NL15-2K]
MKRKRERKDRWWIHVRQHVQRHVSSERVCASCEVFLVIAWLIEHQSWI